VSSPSATSKVKGCARKFALGLFEPYVQGPEAALGDQLHDQADDYQSFGKAPDLTTTAGLMLDVGMPYMPHPRTGTAEGKVSWITPDGLRHNFRMDLRGFVRDLPQTIPGIDPDMPYVLDYKSQKDKDGREKDSQLRDKASFLADEEAILYAFKAMYDSNKRECYLRWLYLRGPKWDSVTGLPGKLRPKATPRDVIVSLDEVVSAYHRTYAPFAKVVDQIYDVKDKKKLTVLSAMSLPPNPFQCTKYGAKYACPHIDRCALPPDSLLTTQEESYGMQLQGNDLFAAMSAAMNPPSAIEAAIATPVQVAVNPQPAVNPLAFMTPAVPVTTTPVVDMPSSPAFVNPPEAPHVTPVSEALKEKCTPGGEFNPSELSMDSDEALGFAVRVLVTFFVKTYKRG
jgi:hypothetical protein